jgi:hypothetical protein
MEHQDAALVTKTLGFTIDGLAASIAVRHHGYIAIAGGERQTIFAVLVARQHLLLTQKCRKPGNVYYPCDLTRKDLAALKSGSSNHGHYGKN